jgi:hypothetical protein
MTKLNAKFKSFQELAVALGYTESTQTVTETSESKQTKQDTQNGK